MWYDGRVQYVEARLVGLLGDQRGLILLDHRLIDGFLYFRRPQLLPVFKFLRREAGDALLGPGKRPGEACRPGIFRLGLDLERRYLRQQVHPHRVSLQRLLGDAQFFRLGLGELLLDRRQLDLEPLHIGVGIGFHLHEPGRR